MKRPISFPLTAVLAAFAASVAIPGSAYAQNVGVDGDETTSGSGRFQTPNGLCLIPSDVPARVGTHLVLGSCDAASKQPLTLGPGIDPVRTGTQGTVLSNNLCLNGSPLNDDVTFQVCHPICQATNESVPPGFCYNPGAFDDGTEGYSLDQSQEWTWNGGRLESAPSRFTTQKCLTTSNPITGAEASLAACAVAKAGGDQTFLPLDFYMMFASGLSQPGYGTPNLPTTAPRTLAITPPTEPVTTFECLDVSSNLQSSANDPLDAFACNATVAQWFHFTANHELVTTQGTCVTAGGAYAQAPVEIEGCSDSLLQQWSLNLLTPEIHNTGSGMCLDVSRESDVSGTGAVVAPCAFAGTSPSGQAWAPNLVWPTLHVPPTASYGSATASLLQWEDTSTLAGWGGGWWIDQSQQVAGDFDGDGYSDVAFVFKTGDGYIDVDVYLHSENYLHANRWSTNQGGWINGMTFLAGDFDGDGRSDIADAFDLGDGQLQVDVHLSTGSEAAGGFLPPRRWAYNQGGTIGRATWIAGDFNGDHKTDLAYIFADSSSQIAIDVHESVGNHATTSNGFALSHWAHQQGGWIDIQVTDPARTDPFYQHCNQCTRQGQWVAGDFNGDQRTDLGLAYRNGSSMINLDVHLSTPAGFVLQNASIAQGGWPDQSFWVAADMDNDGRDDMVDIFADSPYTGVDIDVHSSRVHGFTVPNASGFVLQRYASTMPLNFWMPDNDTIDTPIVGAYPAADSLGYMFAGAFSHASSSHFADIAVVSPTGFYVPDAQYGIQNVGVTVLH